MYDIGHNSMSSKSHRVANADFKFELYQFVVPK